MTTTAGADTTTHPPGTAELTAGEGRTLRAVKVMWQREWIRFSRNKVRILMGMITPMMFLLILGTGLNGTVGGADYRAYLFPGVLLMAVQSPAMAVGISIVWDRQSGFLRQMLVAPVRRGALLGGLCLGGATTGAVYGLLVLLVAGYAGIPYGPELLLGLLEVALVAFAFTAIGVLAAVRIRRIDTFQIVVGIAVMPMLFLSGAMFPVGGLPTWLGAAVLANPLTYGVDALRRTLPGDLDLGGLAVGPRWWGWAPPVLLEVGIVALIAAVALMAATRRFARAD
ncbi:ABC transporter permease [Actinophytocola oryzae]|uniref:Transport permease protein n=1 Tax=Actinophytocola oryzae TaxID=502181 RepID=A0A4R7VKF1_9PSEU|nr:ABC transporter permease [Actinophytocola oryzae]TDV49668.1 ABC-2 type transport system permease protein [Actinophytocola oryzae]